MILNKRVMEKGCLFVVALFVSIMGSFAQNKIEIGFGSGSFSESSGALSTAIHYSYGIVVSSAVCVGVGSGIRYYLGPGHMSPGGEPRFSFSDHYREWAIPAFCFVKYNMSMNSITPFIGTRVGVNIPVVMKDFPAERKTGLVYRGGFVEPWVGVSFGRRDKQSFSVGISVLFQNLRNTIEEKSGLSIAPMLCLGYSF